MFRKPAAALAVLVAAGAALAAAPAATAAPVIQPGIEISTDVGGCTASFVYDGGGKTYIGTAAHCVDKVGDDVATGDGTVFGDVAHIGNADTTEDDYAFIEVRPGFQVNAAVKGHPDMPTGVAKAADTSAGDTVQFSGYGLGFGLTQPTQEQRIGVITQDDESVYNVLGPVIFGDSGGPLVHIPSKGAYGIVSRLCVGSPCWVEGPTVEGALAKAAANGFVVTLRTV